MVLCVLLPTNRAADADISVCAAGVSSVWNHLQLSSVHGSCSASCSGIQGVDVWWKSGTTYTKPGLPGTERTVKSVTLLKTEAGEENPPE